MKRKLPQTQQVSKSIPRYVEIKHEHYSLTYDTELHYPTLVNWVEVDQDLVEGSTSVDRGNNFQADPILNESVQQVWESGDYDRGHNCPAKDNQFSEQAETESFYYTNMTPQHPNLNRITWKKLEEITRLLAKNDKRVEVWCGSYGDIGKIGNTVTIPEYCWKIIKYDNRITLAFIMPNKEEVNEKHYIQYLTTVEEIRRQSGLSLQDI